jgi:hypothetical protein
MICGTAARRSARVESPETVWFHIENKEPFAPSPALGCRQQPDQPGRSADAELPNLRADPLTIGPGAALLYGNRAADGWSSNHLYFIQNL